MKKISKKELNKILENHKLWLESCCIEGEKADLTGTILEKEM